MLTYLVEDSPPKVQGIVKFLIEHFPALDVCVYGSYHSALSAIESRAPELVLLDMTLPNFDRRPGTREGRLRPLGGYDLMRKLRLRRVASRIIIITQLEEFGEDDERVTFPEVVELCKREFPGQLVGAVYYDQGSKAEWQETLAKLLGGL